MAKIIFIELANPRDILEVINRDKRNANEVQMRLHRMVEENGVRFRLRAA